MKSFIRQVSFVNNGNMDYVTVNIFSRPDSHREFDHICIPLSRTNDEVIFSGAFTLKVVGINVKVCARGDYYIGL